VFLTNNNDQLSQPGFAIAAGSNTVLQHYNTISILLLLLLLQLLLLLLQYYNVVLVLQVL